MKRPQCTATSKHTGERCKLPCVEGKKVCRIHGGRSPGGKKGNKNALKTGRYETISRSTMTDEEIKYANDISIDPVDTLKEQLRILKVKELRIARRIKNTMEKEALAGQKDKDGKIQPNTVLLTVSTTKTTNFQGETSTVVSSTGESFAQNYLRLEQAHNAIQAQISRTAALLMQMQQETGEGDEPLPLYTLPPEEVEKKSHE